MFEMEATVDSVTTNAGVSGVFVCTGTLSYTVFLWVLWTLESPEILYLEKGDGRTMTSCHESRLHCCSGHSKSHFGEGMLEVVNKLLTVR